MSNLSSVIKSIQDVMRQDSGLDGESVGLPSLTTPTNVRNQEATC